MEILSKVQILSSLQMATNELLDYCTNINDQKFFFQPTTKWSIAQNITHLTTSTRITTFAYRLPKVIIRLYSGKPNRLSRSYDELVKKYKLKLEQGGSASGIFIPKVVVATVAKHKLILDFSTKMKALITAIEKNWHDHQLDQYIIPHPLLGKITLRELSFFTIYHTYHHLLIIKER